MTVVDTESLVVVMVLVVMGEGVVGGVFVRVGRWAVGDGSGPKNLCPVLTGPPINLIGEKSQVSLRWSFTNHYSVPETTA